MGNRLSSSEPVIMTTAFLEEKIIQTMVKSQSLDISELQRLKGIDGLEYDVVFSLDLEHQSLVNIDELWVFKYLSKLELANNYLEKIEGLDSLVNLQHLDLSFNFIKCISNLENLVNLHTLNLTSNEIDKLENMESLKLLKTLLIKHNKIKSFDNIYYLTQFNNLTCLTVDYNPFMNETDARLHVLAVLPELKYLDFIDVTPDQIRKAFDKFLPENDKSVCEEKVDERKFKCNFLHSDKEAFVEGIANGQGFHSFLLSDRNYQLLNSFPPASEISQEHCSEVTKIFDEWHEIGHKYYEQMLDEKSKFLLMISKAKEFSSVIFQKEELKFIEFKENIPKELCFIYQSNISDDEKDKAVVDFKKRCEDFLHNTFKNFMNSSLLCVDLMCNICKVYEKEISLLHAKYIQEIKKLSEDLIHLNEVFAEKLQEFYFGIQKSGFDASDYTILSNLPLLQLIQNKEIIQMTLKVSTRINATMLKERIRKLKKVLDDDLMETVHQASDEAFMKQSELVRSTVIFCNKQKYFINRLFIKSNIYKHFLGYR